jgi:hypothetical protein
MCSLAQPLIVKYYLYALYLYSMKRRKALPDSGKALFFFCSISSINQPDE